MKWLGLTGGIGCGKSTVSRSLQAHGIPVIDADDIAKKVVETGSAGLRSIVTAFGPQVLQADGSLDRRKLGQIVFGHPQRLKQLESLLHPLIQAETLRQRQKLEQQGESIAVYDVPLLFETKAQDQFDYIVVVSCTPEQQKERLRRRNAYSEKEIEERVSAQLPLSRKEEDADFVLHNDQDEQHLIRETDRLMKWIQELKGN